VIFSESEDDDETDGGDPDELVDQFKEFIEGVRPEDFTS
jgi:hypothetical protein